MIPPAHCVYKPMGENDGQVSVMCLFQIPSVLAWRPGGLVCVGLSMCFDGVSYLYTGLLLSGNSVGCYLDSIVGY